MILHRKEKKVQVFFSFLILLLYLFIRIAKLLQANYK